VSNLTEVAAPSASAALQAIRRASANRVVARTTMNASSSRGHAVYQIYIEATGAKLMVADLAGRENERTAGVSGRQLRELAYINKSLFHLSNVIQGLSKSKKFRQRGQIPFRNSKLTLLLSDCLKSMRTTVVATVSPAAVNDEETFSTLRLAQSLQQITTRTRFSRARSATQVTRRIISDLDYCRAPDPAMLPWPSWGGQTKCTCGGGMMRSRSAPISFRRQSATIAVAGAGTY